MRRLILIVLIAASLFVLAACAAAQPQQSVAAAEASETASQPVSDSGLPAVFQSASPSSKQVMAGASQQVSVSVSQEAAKTVDKIMDENALNSVFAANAKLVENGEQMVVGINGNTVTYNLTFSRDIKATDLPSDFTTTMETSLQDAINKAVELYPGLPDCTFVYNVINGVSGQTLLTVSKEYTAD
jgi:glucose/arabinose dehydrogenase